MPSDKDKQGYMLIAGVLAVVVVLGALKAATTPQQPGPDLCVGEVDASTAILIDRSDDVTEQTRDEIRARALAYVKDSVRENERVSVFAINQGSSTALMPLISLCRPRRYGSRMTENVRVIEKRYRESFEGPLNSALRVPAGSSAESPIAQALTDISLSHYLNSKRNTLIVFSDMLENTPRFSLYQCDSPDAVIDRYRQSRIGAQERPKFMNTSVRLNIIPRLGQSRDEVQCRDRLWTWFFGDDAGADAGLAVHYLPGGPPVNPRVEARGS